MSENSHSLLPHDLDSEAAVIGALAIDPHGVYPQLIDSRVTREVFYSPAHAIVFENMLEFYDQRQGIDLLMFTQVMRKKGILDEIGGAAFITSLFNGMPTSRNVAYYIKEILDKWTFRQAIAIGKEIIDGAFEQQDEPMSFLDKCETRIHSIGEGLVKAKRFSIKEVTGNALDSIEKIYERKGQISGISTGFGDLDNMTDGLHGPDMIVIAARPSMGKTALAMNIAEHVGLDQKLPVGVFSLEMSSSQLVTRMLYSRSRISSQNVRDGMMSERDFHRLNVVSQEVAGSKIIIDDTAGLSILELRAKARRWKKEHGIRLIVIDYLQLLKSPTQRGRDNRQIEIAEISSGIKALAKELDIPIIVLAQLNRNPEGRAGGKPRLSDLRESGAIEQDADFVGLLTRSEYYADAEDRDAVAGKAELIIAKQRNGPVGEVALTFIKACARFESFSGEKDF